MHTVTKIIAIIVFGFFAILACSKLIYTQHPYYYAVVVLFYCQIIAIYIFRKPPTVGVNNWQEWLIPLIVSFAPLFFISYGNESTTYAFGYVLAAVGMGLAIWGLAYLRMNFSVFVEARECVTGGPYQLIRHPL